jgi:V8-like Glu-specific endopeptidase
MAGVGAVRALGFGAAALFLGGVPSALGQTVPDSPTQPVIVHAPDLSHYDCSTAAAPGAKNALHIGQVINNRYYEWNEIYAVDGGQQNLLCVSLTVPQAQQLDATQAKDFLLRSAAVGVPTPGAASNNQLEHSESAEPTDVKPEPKKHVLPGSAPRAPDPTPPIPAEHHASDPSPTVPPPPSIERPQAANGFEGETALSTEQRSLIDSATAKSFPYNTIGYLTVTYPNGESFRCTGTLVSAYVVVTAGHCVHNNNRGGWVKTVRFSAAQNAVMDGGPVRPYGSNTDLANLKATQQWTQISGPDSFNITDYRYDYAAIQFNTAFTFTSTFMPVLYSSTGSPANNSGYPANVVGDSADQYGQFFMSGNETSASRFEYRTSDVREFSIQSSGGDSGGPFWVLDATGRRSLVGSLSYGDDSTVLSGGPWYDSWNQSLLSSWVSWTPGSTSTSLSVTGLRVGEILASSATTGQSYLRFYNAGTSAGTVTITLSDASSGTPLASWISPSIPAGASPQYGLSTIEGGATPSFTKPAIYSIAIQTAMTGSFQHVLWHAGDGSLTNLSTCDGGPSSMGQTVMNVHTSLLSGGYPSTVVIFNTGASSAIATLGIYDATSGTRLAIYNTASIPANGQLSLPVGALESGAGISPGNLYHYVIKITNQFTGFLQHLVNNSQSGVTTDMTAVCTLVH